jgi:hypothetical protein
VEQLVSYLQLLSSESRARAEAELFFIMWRRPLAAEALLAESARSQAFYWHVFACLSRPINVAGLDGRMI